MPREQSKDMARLHEMWYNPAISTEPSRRHDQGRRRKARGLTALRANKARGLEYTEPRILGLIKVIEGKTRPS